MFEPMRARFASSCSKNGISAVDTLTSCIGDTSMKPIFSGGSTDTPSPIRVSTLSPTNCPASSSGAVA